MNWTWWVLTYSQLVGEYIVKPSFEAAIGLIQNLGMINNERIDRYLANVKHFQANRMMKGLMFLGIRIGKIHTRLVEAVLSAIPRL